MHVKSVLGWTDSESLFTGAEKGHFVRLENRCKSTNFSRKHSFSDPTCYQSKPEPK